MTESREAARGRKRPLRRRILMFGVYLGVVVVLLLEGGVRLLTEEKDGYLIFNRLRQVPYPVLSDDLRAILHMDAKEFPYVIPDRNLGWTIRANGRNRDGLFASNEVGLRSAPAPVRDPKPTGSTRVLLVGDSYTHGDEVPWPDTWAAQLQDALGGDFEVLNGGVPGYGTDQALLRARDLRETLRPDVVVLGIYLQDLLRNLTLFRVVKHPFTQFPWSKPRFILDGEGVELINHPVEAWPPPEVERVFLDYERSPLSRHDRMWWPELYEESGWYGSRLWRYWESRRIHRERYDATQRFTREGGEGVLVTARIARLFREETQAEGIRAYVVLLPGVEGLPGYREGGRPPLRYLHGELERVSVPFADAGTALWQSLDHGSGEKPEVLYVNGVGHPNRRANGVIARVVATLVRP